MQNGKRIGTFSETKTENQTPDEKVGISVFNGRLIYYIVTVMQQLFGF